MSDVRKLSSENKGTFVVRTRKNKSGSVRWYLKFQYTISGKTTEVSVSKDLYFHFGFDSNMKVIEAKERVKRLNSEREIVSNRSYINSAIRVKNELKFDETFFPKNYIDDFLIYLEEKTHGGEKRYKKVLSHFAAAQRLVRDTKLLPEEYAYRSSKIYKWFIEHQYSPDYTQSILRVLNLWGQFVSRQQGGYFEPVDAPRGRIKSNIKSSYKSKGGKKKESLPLTPRLLQKSKDKLEQLDIKYWNWLYISLWFGLRPLELDNLAKEVRIEEQEGVDILCVYQTKLADVEEDDDKWKYIPIIFQDQRVALDIIKNKNFKRPHPKIVRKYVSEGITLYGGRKGFTDLMLDLDQKIEDISMWLGHKTIERTWKSYKNKKKISFTKTSKMIKKV